MQQSFLGKLQRTALLNLLGALCLLLLVPALQLLVLGPLGYGTALDTAQSSLAWIHSHTALFVLYRLALCAGFALLLGLPFALFRIIIAQEIVGRAELAEQEGDDYDEEAEEEGEFEEEAEEENEAGGLPAFAWRGKGFAVLAAWSGTLGLLLLAGTTLASTIYLWSSAGTSNGQTPVPENFAGISTALGVLTYTVGGGFLALACIFFGIVIARSGRKLWPDSWVAFGYIGMAIGAIASGSAVQVAIGDQTALTTPAILGVALWALWFSSVVLRLKPELATAS